MTRRAAERGGRRAETLAAWWLRLRGWRIIATRARTPVGEIDLVARRGATLAFVDEKARAGTAEADLALDEFRLRRVARAAEAAPPATPGPATRSGSMRSSSCPTAGRVMSKISGMGDSARAAA